ncbi:hypothetical protein [Citrobacter freundii]|uniref:Uncharacterized protein n=1 Tax=Citrobacter freundii TaxID=546 RepID=A0A7G2IS07_CITFR|nr:hypothetical protein [Citrobacter freundii]
MGLFLVILVVTGRRPCIFSLFMNILRYLPFPFIYPSTTQFVSNKQDDDDATTR